MEAAPQAAPQAAVEAAPQAVFADDEDEVEVVVGGFAFANPTPSNAGVGQTNDGEELLTLALTQFCASSREEAFISTLSVWSMEKRLPDLLSSMSRTETLRG